MPDPKPDEETEPVEAGTVLAHPETRAPAVDPQTQTLKMLRSLKRAAWFVVVLLALIITAIFRRCFMEQDYERS